MAKKKTPLLTEELMDDLVACCYDKLDPGAFIFNLKEEMLERFNRAKDSDQRQELTAAYMALRDMSLFELEDRYEKVMRKIREEDHWEYMVPESATLEQKIIGTLPGECFWMTLDNGETNLFEKQIGVTYQDNFYALLINISTEGGKEVPKAVFYQFKEGTNGEEDKAILVTDETLNDILSPLAVEEIKKWRAAQGWNN